MTSAVATGYPSGRRALSHGEKEILQYNPAPGNPNHGLCGPRLFLGYVATFGMPVRSGRFGIVISFHGWDPALTHDSGW
jgi:hypothetical protein